jgi:hypothetical protein
MLTGLTIASGRGHRDIWDFNANFNVHTILI